MKKTVIEKKHYQLSKIKLSLKDMISNLKKSADGKFN